MRTSLGALVIPVLLSAALAQAQTRGKSDAGPESPIAQPAPSANPPAATVQQLAPGQAIPLGILPASPGGTDTGQNAAPRSSAPATPAITDWIGRSFTVPQRTAIFSAPDTGAASSGSLAEGADADVVGVLEGRDWLKVRLPDGSFGYVRSASIPAVTGQAAAQSSPPSGTQQGATAAAPVGGDIYVGGPVQGPAAVHDTATLVVNERALPLYAVDGFGGEPALAMQEYVDGEGRAVKCDPLESKGFVCTLQDGTDVAKAALVNGAARATPDAPADYLAQQEDAKKSKRGIWRDGADKVDSVPYSREAAGAVVLSDSFVAGVRYAGPNGVVPAAFKAASPIEGLAIIGEQPFTLADGDPTPVLYRPGVGWGFWDRYFVWRRVPVAWIPRLEQIHPHGANLHQVNLANYGFVQSRPYFLGPAVDVSFIPNQPPVAIGYGPYPSPVFAPYLDPGYVAVGAAAAIGLAGIVGGALPPPGRFGPPGMPGMPGGFRPPPGGFGFGPGGHPPGFGPGPSGFGRMAGFGGPGPHFGGPMGAPGHFGGPGGPPGGHFGGPMMGGPMGGPGRGAFGVRPVGGPGMMGGGFGRPGGMPMGMGGRPGGMPMGMGGRPGGMPMGMGGRPGGMPMGMAGRPGGMPMGGGRPGGMMMGGGAPRMGGFGGGGRPAMPAGGGVHMAGGAPGRHH